MQFSKASHTLLPLQQMVVACFYARVLFQLGWVDINVQPVIA